MQCPRNSSESQGGGILSKKYKGKLCVYCGTAPSTTADHIIAREFFLNERRGNLPKAPACEKCNREKSVLEHYLTAVLPFGGRHADAIVNLETMIPPRLQRNEKLYSELSSGLAPITDPEGRDGYANTLPFDSARLEQLFAQIAKGLAWHHWRVLLQPGYSATSAFFMDQGGPIIEAIFSQAAMNRVTVDLGEGTFSYKGLQDAKESESTVWRFSIYGGASFGGDPDLPGQKASQVIAVTGPDVLIQRLQDGIFGRNRN